MPYYPFWPSARTSVGISISLKFWLAPQQRVMFKNMAKAIWIYLLRYFQFSWVFSSSSCCCYHLEAMIIRRWNTMEITVDETSSFNSFIDLISCTVKFCTGFATTTGSTSLSTDSLSLREASSTTFWFVCLKVIFLIPTGSDLRQ